MMQKIAEYLHEEISYYDWVGFYLVEEEDVLSLGPYVGEPTVHTRISFGQGICGQAAAKKDTFVIQDVSKETNYLSCNAEVKSEIVLPVMKDGKILGELDIDSHSLAPFDDEDKKFLNWICNKLANSKIFLDGE
jgi:L-methionine (R)-S-oxide reductase